MTEKILFEGRRAVGVSFRRDGRLCIARAKREVSLCGGAVNSPQLLMLSGIGPQEHVAGFGIPIVHHLPGVGQSLQDHYSAAIKLRCKLPITVNDVMLSNARKLKAGLEYYMFHPGRLAMISSPAALFARTRPELASPDDHCGRADRYRLARMDEVIFEEFKGTGNSEIILDRKVSARSFR